MFIVSSDDMGMRRGTLKKRTRSSYLSNFSFFEVHASFLCEGILDHPFGNTQAWMESYVRLAPWRAFVTCRILISIAFGSSNDRYRAIMPRFSSTSTRVSWRTLVTAFCFRFVPSPYVFPRSSDGSQGVQHR